MVPIRKSTPAPSSYAVRCRVVRLAQDHGALFKATPAPSSYAVRRRVVRLVQDHGAHP